MSTPVFDPDDPRLTAYALGESSPAERVEIERLLAVSPEARAVVEKTVALARDLEAEYRRENEVYWDTRGAGGPANKVVQFPGVRQAGRKTGIAFAWKIAAVVAVLGTLVHLTLRRSSLPQNTPLASTRSTEVAPPPVQDTQPRPAASPAPSSIVQATIPLDADKERAPVATPEASNSPAAGDADTLLAMTADQARRDDEPAARSAVQPAAPTLESNRMAKSATRREAGAAAAPGTNAPSAPAAAAGSGSASPLDRISRSVVRIRAGDGTYVGGVVVTVDGWILAASVLSRNGTQPMVILADRRELPASVTPAQSGSDLCRLRIEEKALPAVALATKSLANNEALTVASSDRHTGATRFLRARAVVSGASAHIQWQDQPLAEEAAIFAFNASGELLGMMALPPVDKPESRMRAASDRAVAVGPTVRPFTAAERTFLQSTTANPTP